MSARSTSSGNLLARSQGPTPSLPLLHALLRALKIPILPSTLSATSPSLLLILLETLLANRLPLPQSIRSCSTPSDEIAVIKCILGVLAHDILGMDLVVIDPVQVVSGATQELEVVVMALAVVAKRSGLDVRVPCPPEDSASDVVNWDAGVRGDDEDLCPPIRPDVSFSSSGPLSPPSSASIDVFGVIDNRARPPSSFLFDRDDEVSGVPEDLDHRKSSRPETPSPESPWFMGLEEPSSFVTDQFMCGQAPHSETRSDWTPPLSSSSQGSKTVFQSISEELGLGPSS